MKKILSLVLALAMLLSLASFSAAEEAVDTRTRTIVTTDLECDDIDSLLHLLLYSNDIDIAAIVVTSSTHHWTGDGVHTLEEVYPDAPRNGYRNSESRMNMGNDIYEWRPMDLDWVYETIREDYAAVYPNLVKHDSRYPSPGELVARTKIGNVQFEADTKEPTEGSEIIKDCLLDDDPRTLYVQAWGGANSLARALMSIEEEYKGTEQWDEIYRKVSDKLVFVSWGNQDQTYANYIAPNWPEIGRLLCVSGGIGYRTSMTTTVPYREFFKPEWMMENIKFGHGDLMGGYLLWGDGTYYEGELYASQFGDLESLGHHACFLKSLYGIVERYEFISEGDSPCWMYLIPVGLRGLENAEYGSWGGRMENVREGKAISEYDPTLAKMSSGYSVHRWFPAFMNDWAARADWCVTDYEDANHQPVVTAEVLDFEVAPGATVELVGSATDPDGDNLNCNWWIYKDACVYSGASLAYLDVWAHDVAATSFTVPADAADGDYFNIVFEVTDDGAPALTRYAQAIVKVVAPAAE